MKQEKEFNTINLAKLRTLYANQRTHLSYIRTGLAGVIIGIKLKNYMIVYGSIILILFDMFQYYTNAVALGNGKIIFPNKEIPVLFSIIIIIAIYYII